MAQTLDVDALGMQVASNAAKSRTFDPDKDEFGKYFGTLEPGQVIEIEAGDLRDIAKLVLGGFSPAYSEFVQIVELMQVLQARVTKVCEQMSDLELSATYSFSRGTTNVITQELKARDERRKARTAG